MAKAPPLVFEEIQDDLNYIFLTLIEYKKIKYLTIVENVIDDEIHAYALDNLAAEGIDIGWFMSVAVKWFYASSERYPLSFEFAKLGMGEVIKRSIRTFNINATSRVIGKLFTYNLAVKPKIRRRKVQPIPENITVKFKPLAAPSSP